VCACNAARPLYLEPNMFVGRVDELACLAFRFGAKYAYSVHVFF
jgi:hypothetical protein